MSRSSSSSGVRGRLDEVTEVEDEARPGVDCEDSGIGGGVTDIERWLVAMWMVGRARQKDEVLVAFVFGAVVAVTVAVDEEAVGSGLRSVVRDFPAALTLFLSRSRSLFSLFFSRRET